MLKKLVNEAFCTLRIETTEPLLVKSGEQSTSGPDMAPVVTYRNGRREVFIPGSSLKGVFRSHIEKIISSLQPGVVCYPFEGVEERQVGQEGRQQDFRDSCGGSFNRYSKQSERHRQFLEERTDLVYQASCPVCRLFGSTGFIGRIAISDAYLIRDEINDTYLVEDKITERRDGVGIDRLTGGASHGAKFELKVVRTGVVFETEIHLRNFEIWQLGMLFVILDDLQDELIHIGSGRSRGLGRVRATLSERQVSGRPGGFVTSALLDSQEPVDQLWGLGRWLNDKSYGTWPDDYLPLALPVERVERGIRAMRSFGSGNQEQFNAMRQVAMTQFIQRVKNWPPEFAKLPEPAGKR
jgi:CRISPR-associated RAMP protein (TIGR02581 family)